ncbi:hypothetical protein SAMN05421780_106232 [Flexibacter flexilis DSM 6793]|uniref:Ezrin/radixin/moesin family protein n=1 Tax=Flexibacter flexilis DSM 6793 TaxID=927664 RepID=A0A1I1K4B5_9BACT|nr:hypothetical protein [Flexibacter flexilis]SFC55351.1 hypothetical protein SAMN05421780_106232 [Flexibacter flexilis DSM 6793]
MDKRFFLGLLLTLTAATVAYSQDDKKEWAKKLKATDPLEFKKIVQEREQSQGEVKRLNEIINDAQKELNDTKAENAKLQAQLDQLKKSGAGAKTAGKTEVDATKPAGSSKGIIFKVQIGSFKNKDLAKYFNNNPNFSGDVDEDGSKKYTLGYFRDYWEADTFKKYLREMGVKDAWIVSYKDGKRVPIKEVLEGAI